MGAAPQHQPECAERQRRAGQDRPLIVAVDQLDDEAHRARTGDGQNRQADDVQRRGGVLLFAGLTSAAVAMRKRTDWHRRLHLCAMAALLAPGFGRLLPMPLMIPWSYQIAMACGLAFPIAGVIRDLLRTGRVHRAWMWGIGVTLAVMIGTEAIVYSPVGDAIYAWVTAGTPGASVAPLEFGPMPPMG